MSDTTTTLKGNSLPQEIQLLTGIVIAAVTQNYTGLNTLLQKALEQNVKPIALYEALLQTYLFAGFPAALESLSLLSKTLQHHSNNNPNALRPSSEPYNVENFRRRGEVLCRQIYTSAFDKMTTLLKQSSPELHEWMLIEGYGKTLSREGLSISIRELLNVAVLAVLGWERQLYSHLRGALNVGVTIADCEGVLGLLPTITFDQQQKKQRAIQVFQQVRHTFITK